MKKVYSGTDALMKSVPPVHSRPEWAKKISPGISTYHGDKLRDLWPHHLKKLIQHAESIVPSDQQYETPVFLLATAGMRLLPERDQQEILAATCRQLQSRTSFYLPECVGHVTVIDGETEGLYGWLGLNYLVGGGEIFSDAATNQARSYGFMDMGGASAQIAFAPNRTETKRHEEDLFHVNLRTIDGKDHDWKVFVSTWLGFGANEARNRFSERLVEQEPALRRPEVVKDPCAPRGLRSSLKGTSVNSTVEFEGTGDFGHCLASMYPLLQKELPCKDDPCLFNGVHVPSIDYNTNRFVGVSEYWYTANDVFKMGGKYDFVKFSSKTKEFCEQPWDRIVAKAKKGEWEGVPMSVLKSACFKATWIINILHEGFRVPMTRPNHKRSLDEQSSSWLDLNAIGNNSLDFIHDDDDTLGKRGLSDFMDPFQSATHVNGRELSWTLGRAIMYSSSQVAPRSHTPLRVGYQPAAIENLGFVAGGELEGSPKPQMPSHVRGHGAAMLVLLLFLFFLLGGVLYNFMGGKAQRNFAFGSIRQRLQSATVRSVGVLRSVKHRIFGHRGEPDYRLLEEGGANSEFIGLGIVNDNISMKDNSVPPPSAEGSPYGLRPFSSAQRLATTTSMADLKNMDPARVSSRIGMRAAESSPTVFSLDGEGYASDTETRSKRAGTRTPKF
ncbi:golgi apyrase [Trichomonascus vanleenenianus]|uniref:apyrase n=1 Tax=Trichomonascus vanleenenianus TaxID=2268995 RepID=UPI003ECA8B5A